MKKEYETNYGRKSPSATQGGFTLIELLIAMAIGTIVIAAVVAIYSSLTRSYTTESVRASAQQDIRSAMSLMCHDILHAGMDPYSSLGDAFDLTKTNAESIAFVADLNYDGIAGPDEQFRYYRSGTELRQQLGTAALGIVADDVLLDNVTALSFGYLPNINNPQVITITLAVQVPAGREGMVTRSLTTQVRLRNVAL